ncbi:hypothetical protein HHK36_010996 [Tetracentron sinense]|uniref:Retrovirus-related Pol polyprotein from transposon TNT 1-94-like beta-barrel domain-containing protein n=1 Tax=Tetracentron sinense TaxID=13715 RepID=A0A835DK27_TETSI|nr:hypothetical protein HHK36_010996 [Tetracentron sinense]
MTGNQSIFVNMDTFTNSQVRMRNGVLVQAKGKGTIAIETKKGAKYIQDVLLVPDLEQNLLSVGQLVEYGKESSLLPSVFTPSATAAKAPSRTYTRPPSTITAPASSLARIGQQSPAATPSLTISAIDPSHYQFVDLPPPGIFQNFFVNLQSPPPDISTLHDHFSLLSADRLLRRALFRRVPGSIQLRKLRSSSSVKFEFRSFFSQQIRFVAIPHHGRSQIQFLW